MKIKSALLPLALMCIFSFGSAEAAKLTAEKLYNFKPDSGDVIVPMPCNGIMAFRKVYTSKRESRIDDKTFMSGLTGTSSPISENQSKRFVQGAFHDKGGWYFLIAKYELMQGQYDSLFSDGKCRELSAKDRMPAVNISYSDALKAAENFSVFLFSDKGNIVQDGAKAFARLPSDEEWEFAARGGLAVSQAEFEAKLPPMESEINDYAWLKGAGSSNGKLSAAGLKKPNPLGLYDMFGNASEMVLEPYKAVRGQRLFGQVGGICVRGGSFRTSDEDNISSASRAERPFYGSKGPTKDGDMSTRFVLGLQVINSIKEQKDLKQALDNLVETPSSDDADQLSKANEKLASMQKEQEIKNADMKKEQEELAAMQKKLKEQLEEKDHELTEITKSQNDMIKTLTANNAKLKKAQEELQSQVNSIGDELKSAQIEVKDKLNALAVQNLRTGAVVCAQISQKQQMLGIFGKILDSAKARYDEKPDDERVKKRYEGIKHNYDSIEKDVNLLSSFYGDFISSAALSFPQKLIEDNFDEAVTSFGSTENARAMVNYDEYMEIYTAHLKKYRANHSDLKKEQKIWIEQCTVNAARSR